MRFLLSVLVFTSCFMLISCGDDDPSVACGEQTIVSDIELEFAPRDQLTIQSLEIVGDCLTVRFSSSGCDGDSWGVRLIGSEQIMESFPPQRAVLLSLDNDEVCDAVISREITFDVSSTQVDGPSIWLNFMDSDESILYVYNQ